jgi:hypothetical protein
MIGPVRPTGPHPPKVWRKDDDRQKEEDAGDFEPQDAAYSPEGAQKATHAASDTAAALNGSSPHRLSCRLAPNCRVRNRLCCRGGLCAAHNLLAYHAADDTQPCSKYPANDLWSHYVYDGSSDAG